jgi:hypothetical protein
MGRRLYLVCRQAANYLLDEGGLHPPATCEFRIPPTPTVLSLCNCLRVCAATGVQMGALQHGYIRSNMYGGDSQQGNRAHMPTALPVGRCWAAIYGAAPCRQSAGRPSGITCVRQQGGQR